MKKTGLMKLACIVFGVLVASMLLPGKAHSWDLATHAYIEEHFHKRQGKLDEQVMHNRIYGASAIDIFNNNFTSPYMEFAAYLHDPTQNNFLNVWEEAGTKAENAFAYGFVGHNNTWGMDSTAHISGITHGRGKGYVIAKAEILAAMLGPSLESQGLDLPDDVLVNICHYLVESGVDFLVRTMDPSIGTKLMAAANSRSDEVPTLLINAYADDFSALAGGPEEAAMLIATAESQFRYTMMAYGFVLTKDNALDLVAEGLAKVGADYLGLPPEYKDALVPVAKQGIFAAMALCAPDIEAELRATTGWVNGNLSSNGISW